MLVELVVENFAVVESLRLGLHAGLNALTGETGSGKSLVVDALGLLLGGRASTELIRTGAARAFVSGRFEVAEGAALTAYLAQAGIETEESELLIEREILANGKSRAYAASRPVTAAFLKDLAPFLGDIHGQHDQQKLFSPDAQRELLDEAAAATQLLETVGAAYHEWRTAAAELAELNRNEKERLRLADLWSMQKREIEALELSSGEDAALENERRVLKNVARLSEHASAAYDAPLGGRKERVVVPRRGHETAGGVGPHRRKPGRNARKPASGADRHQRGRPRPCATIWAISNRTRRAWKRWKRGWRASIS